MLVRWVKQRSVTASAATVEVTPRLTLRIPLSLVSGREFEVFLEVNGKKVSHLTLVPAEGSPNAYRLAVPRGSQFGYLSLVALFRAYRIKSGEYQVKREKKHLQVIIN